jgi:ssDNA-binding Zn-finger/Zn-ribbon topoisomerase 1
VAEFVCKPGFANCPKCGGWQVLDKTKRKADGWPLGELRYVECDHCQGAGQIATGWAIKLVKPQGEVVTMGDDVPMPEGWGNYVG